MKSGLLAPTPLFFPEVRKPYPPPRSGAVLYLPGYPPLGTTIKDFSGSGNHGTIIGAQWERLPSGLWVLSFDGVDDYVDAGTGASLNPTTITVGAWGKTETGIGGDAVVAKKADVLAGYSLEGGARVFWVYDGTAWRTSNSAPALTVGQWYHIVGTYDGTTVKIYQNGTLVNSVTYAAGTISSATNPLNIGQDFASPGVAIRMWKGLIGGVRIYNRALTSPEIQLDYNRERCLFGV